MSCACGRGLPGRRPDPGVCPFDDPHGPAGGHCICCHEPPRYDTTRGRVILDRYSDGAVRAAVEVRAGLEEAATRTAVIAELRRMGYTVLSPGRLEKLLSLLETGP